MCVIIYIPENETISKEELKNAWHTNPDGAGYAIQKDGKVEYKRGYMNFNKYYHDIKNYISVYPLMLHLRISTGGGINARNTHPYKKGNIKQLEGITKRPVICMNGIISFYNCKNPKLNDTANYIQDHENAFKVLNQDILNIIGEATGSKWAVMLPDKVYLTPDFIKQDGIYYSNLNHQYRSFYNSWYQSQTEPVKLRDYITNKKLLRQINRDRETREELKDYIKYNCSICDTGACLDNCIYYAKNIYDIWNIIDGYDWEI